MNFLEFYTNLPKDLKGFYVRGYTEALKFYTGVRVIPNAGFTEEVGDKKFQECILRVGYPCYCIPILDGRKCLGFVFKGYGKPTPSYRPNTWRMIGQDRIQDNDTVYFVEGIKDSFLLLRTKHRCTPMLSSVPSEAYLRWLHKKNCFVVFISDNDEHRTSNQVAFKKKADFVGLRYLIVNIAGGKDLGEFFDDVNLRPGARQQALANLKGILNIVKQYKKENNL